MTILTRIRRARREEGFGLIELLISMTVLTVGLLALFAAYSSGYTAMKRATRVSSSTLLADSQMERFRALQYANIQLDTACGASCSQDATYTGDTAYSSTAQITTAPSSCTDATCLSTQTKTGPDGKSYRLDTYVDYNCVNGTLVTSPLGCGAGNPSPVKLVTVVVRKTSGGDWVREESTFTSLTGS
jgi:type II secretory pathway pseudopilin PulG